MEDKVLKKLVEDELDFEPRVDANEIGVSVSDGIVRLTGRVGSYAHKCAAEEAVKRIRGVRGYVEDLEVRAHPAQGSDEEIAERVANLLQWDVTLPIDAIKVKVQMGYVTLSGEVEWAYQRTSAETGIRRLPGVRGLTNLIEIKPKVRPADIKQRIEQALERQAELDATRITVGVEGGRVKLGGAVRLWSERDVVERAAWSAPGVSSVEDRITLGA